MHLLQQIIEEYNLSPIVPNTRNNKTPFANWTNEEYQFNKDNFIKPGEVFKWINKEGQNKSGKVTGYCLITGEESNIMVVDLDTKKGKDGIEEFKKVINELNLNEEEKKAINKTLRVKTPSGGVHLYFKYKAGLKTDSDYFEGIDIRTHRGLIVLPGTTIKDQEGNYKTYKVEYHGEIEEMPNKVFEKFKSVAKNIKEQEQQQKQNKQITMRYEQRMTLEEANDYISNQLEDYLSSKGINTSKKFSCIDSSHIDRHPSASIDYSKPGHPRVHCFSHPDGEKWWDTLDCIVEFEHLKDKGEVFKKALEIFNIAIKNNITSVEAKKELPSVDNLKPDSVSEYLSKAFVEDMERFKACKDKKTGFGNLDKIIRGLYTGLYIVGGISSIGKTTFIHQLADQLAEMGEHIIYFSLEQSKLELVSKSLSRITAKQDYDTAVSGIAVRSGYIVPQVIRAAEIYEKSADIFNIIEGNFNTTISTIREYIGAYIKQNGVKPICIIDYLQVIPGDSRLGDKQRVDFIVTELKRISRDFDITIFAISSLNRSNYLAPIDFESFKESGSIEFTADVIWGIQLQAIHDELFNKDGKIKEKREIIRNAKAADPRKIELVCLKNRYGISSYSCEFEYYPKYDLFTPQE